VAPDQHRPRIDFTHMWAPFARHAGQRELIASAIRAFLDED
jgi:hypothetical protein